MISIEWITFVQLNTEVGLQSIFPFRRSTGASHYRHLHHTLNFNMTAGIAMIIIRLWRWRWCRRCQWWWLWWWCLSYSSPFSLSSSDYELITFVKWKGLVFYNSSCSGLLQQQRQNEYVSMGRHQMVIAIVKKRTPLNTHASALTTISHAIRLKHNLRIAGHCN